MIHGFTHFAGKSWLYNDYWTHSHYFHAVSNTHSTHRHLAYELQRPRLCMHCCCVGVVDHAFLVLSAPPAHLLTRMAATRSKRQSPAPRQWSESSSAEKQHVSVGSSQLPIVMEMFEPACGNCRKKYRLPGEC